MKDYQSLSHPKWDCNSDAPDCHSGQRRFPGDLVSPCTISTPPQAWLPL